ncbi:MAG: SH3 domain-containing protein [Lentimicrobium sp.]
MKKFILIIGLFLFFSVISAQDNISVNFGQTYARFKYRDSQGNADENMKSAVHYSNALNYNKILPNGLFIRPELGYKNLGAQSSYNDQIHDWSLHYLDMSIGGGYTGTESLLKPVIGGSLYASYLFKARQIIGSNVSDPIENDDMARMDFGINLIGGVNYAFSESASFIMECRYSIGLKQLDINPEAGQSQNLSNRAFSIHLGLAFKIPEKSLKTRVAVDTVTVQPVLAVPEVENKPAEVLPDSEKQAPVETEEFPEIKGELYTVVGKSVNLRAGPGTEHKVITVIKKGEQVELIIKFSEVWWKVKYKDTSGFVYQSLLDKSEN